MVIFATTKSSESLPENIAVWRP